MSDIAYCSTDELDALVESCLREEWGPVSWRGSFTGASFDMLISDEIMTSEAYWREAIRAGDVSEQALGLVEPEPKSSVVDLPLLDTDPTRFDVSEPELGDVIAKATFVRKPMPYDLVDKPSALATECKRLGVSLPGYVSQPDMELGTETEAAPSSTSFCLAGPTEFARSIDLVAPFHMRFPDDAFISVVAQEPIGRGQLVEFPERDRRPVSGSFTCHLAQDDRVRPEHYARRMRPAHGLVGSEQSPMGWQLGTGWRQALDDAASDFVSHVTRTLYHLDDDPTGLPSSGPLTLGNFQWALEWPQVRFGDSAQQRAEELLLRHLNPRQREDYQTRGFFEVTGGTTGDRYRICNDRQVNVVNKTRRLQMCLVMPSVPLGDQLLAQKLMLESMEDEFELSAVVHGQQRRPRSRIDRLRDLYSSQWVIRSEASHVRMTV